LDVTVHHKHRKFFIKPELLVKKNDENAFTLRSLRGEQSSYPLRMISIQTKQPML